MLMVCGCGLYCMLIDWVMGNCADRLGYGQLCWWSVVVGYAVC